MVRKKEHLWARSTFAMMKSKTLGSARRARRSAEGIQSNTRALDRTGLAIIVIAVVALACAGASAAPITVGTVIGLDVHDPGEPAPSGNFNALIGHGTAPITALPSGTVMDTDGNLLDDVRVRTIITGTSTDPAIGGVDAGALAEGFNADHLSDYGWGATVIFIVFEDLPTHLLYDLVVVSAHDAFDRGTTIRLNGDALTDTVIDTTSNTPFAKYTGLTANTESIEPDSINIHAFGDGVDVINAVRLEAVGVIPTPAALPAGLVLMCMAAGANRRRRAASNRG